MTEDNYEENLKKTIEARDCFYDHMGARDPEVILPEINPAFVDGPGWPNLRQAWKAIRTKDSVIIGSDGLADPYKIEPNVSGNGVEVFAESNDISTSDSVNDLRQSWLVTGLFKLRISNACWSSSDLFQCRLDMEITSL